MENPNNQRKSQSADSGEDLVDDDEKEEVDRSETEGEGQEVSGMCALWAQ